MNLNTEIGNEEPKNEELKDELNESKKSRERKDLEAKGSSNKVVGIQYKLTRQEARKSKSANKAR